MKPEVEYTLKMMEMIKEIHDESSRLIDLSKASSGDKRNTSFNEANGCIRAVNVIGDIFNGIPEDIRIEAVDEYYKIHPRP